MLVAPLCNLALFDDAESVAFEHLGASTRFESDHLSKHGFFAVFPQIVEIRIHHGTGSGDALRLGQHVEMEVCRASRSGGHFAPGVAENPANEIAGRLVVAWITAHALNEEADVLEKAVNLLTERLARTKKVTHHPPVVLQHEARLRLNVCIVICEIVCKELTVFENGVDGLAKESCLATEKAHRFAIAGLEFSDNDSGWYWHTCF